MMYYHEGNGMDGWVAATLARLDEANTPPWTDARPESERTEPMSTTEYARASHDLNGVDRIEISGWKGRYVVEHHVARVVSVLAPRRHPDEFWTFQATTPDGTLRCHSDLIGSPSLITETAEPLKVLLPADRIDRINIIVSER